MSKVAIFNFQLSIYILISSSQVFSQSIAHDTDDNIILFTSFYGKLQFVNSDTMGSWTDTGNGFFLLKMDTDYHIIWNKSLLKRIIGYGSNEEFPITTDDLNNIIATGNFYDSIWYDTIHYSFLPGELYSHAFCVKYSSEGNFLWAITPAGRSSYISSIATDNQGNIYLCGGGGDTLQFSPLPAMFNDRDFGFVVKISPDGIPIWQKQFYSTSSEPYHAAGCNALTLNEDGKLFITGWFKSNGGIATLHVDSDSTNSNTDKTEVFIMSLDTSGEFIWLKDFNCTGEFNYPNEIVAIDTAFFTGGSFMATLSTPPAGNLSTDLIDSYVARFDVEGNAKWSSQGCADCGSNTIWLFGLDNDSSGNIYTTGSFYENLSVDGFPLFNSPEDGSSYMIKYNPDGIPDCIYTSPYSLFNTSVSKAQQIYVIDHLDMPLLKAPYDAGMILSVFDTACNVLYYDTIAWYIDQPLQIDESLLSETINIYPNPAANILNVFLQGDQIDEITYSIYHSTGQLIMTGNLTPGDEIKTINIRSIPKGFYILELSNRSERWIGKFLKE